MQGAQVRSLVGELDPACVLQLIVRMPQLRGPPAATKTQHNQIKKKRERNRNRLTDIENRLVVAKGEEGWGRDGLGVWD